MKAWADYRWGHNGDALRLFAALGVVVGVPVLGALLFATLALLIGDRVSSGRARAAQRRVVLLGLTAELEDARATARRAARACDSGDHLAWTILPHRCIDLALVESAPLDFTRE